MKFYIMDWPDWKRALPHLRWSKAFFEVAWQNVKTEKHAGQHDERGSQEVVKTTSCQRTQRRLRHLALSLPLSLLARSALWPPSSACLVAKIWEGQATHGSWQLSEGQFHLGVHEPMILPTRHSRVLTGLAGAAARLPKSNQQLPMSPSLLKGRKE